ncbi:MAG TPA: histidinol-phosphate transaminase [Mobilitalea sp.]|nr:histidinol-phosphate transaminase [Mobilitalea sp.]
MYYIDENIKNTYRVKCKGARINYLRLDTNENPEGLPREFFDEVMNKVTPELLSMYPEKDNLIHLLSEQNQIEEECISLTNGSDEAIRLVFETFCKPGKKIVSVTPTFEMYHVYSNMFGMIHEEVPYDDNLEISAEKIIDLIDANTNLVVLLNPNSPIGTAYSESEIRAIIEKADRMDAIVIIDEAYHYFYEKTFMHLIKEFNNILIARTFSKLCSLAGLRIGYVVGSKDLIHYIENTQSTYNVNSIGLLFAEEILKRPDIMKDLQDKERRGRDYLIGELNKSEYQYNYQNGNYILIKCNLPSTEVAASLKNKNILIKTYARGLLKDWIRVTTGSKEVMEQFWNEFKLVDKSASNGRPT